MSEKVLTDDEKNALLEGVSSGAVEVHSSAGTKYADVKPFRIPKRSQLRTNSFPRLQTLNQQLAENIAKFGNAQLHTEVDIRPGDIVLKPFGECVPGAATYPAVITFKAEPLDGQALIVIDSATVGQLVEGFFGGTGNDPATRSAGTFTNGELAVCRLFSDGILSMIQEVWESVIELAPEAAGLTVGTDLVNAISDTDPVIATNFEITFASGSGHFSILWPVAMLTSLLPVFDGQKAERDAAEDARWQKVIRTRLPEANISLSGTVGHTRLPLGSLAKLKPGDVIDIDTPRLATIFARDVAVMRGQFGVHAGHNAIEASSWIETRASN